MKNKESNEIKIISYNVKNENYFDANNRFIVF